ncbi:MAG: hypothetical protein AAF327_21115 [Cyanobacteria bacterium P01_A01_bin.37]
MLDILIAGLLLALILASILRRGIQQVITIGLLVLLGVVAAFRIPGRLPGGLNLFGGGQSDSEDVMTVRAAFHDATLAIRAYQNQSIALQENNTQPPGSVPPSEDVNASGSSLESTPAPQISPSEPNDSSSDEPYRSWW